MSGNNARRNGAARVAVAAVLVAAVGLASLSAMSSAATRVHGKGQLVSRVLAYVYPGTKQVPYWGYIVYFRTAGGFPGRSADGSDTSR